MIVEFASILEASRIDVLKCSGYGLGRGQNSWPAVAAVHVGLIARCIVSPPLLRSLAFVTRLHVAGAVQQHRDPVRVVLLSEFSKVHVDSRLAHRV